MKLYLINFYETYRADERGITAMYQLPDETVYYKYEILEETEVDLPHGFEFCETKGYGKEIFKGDEVATMFTKHDGSGYITSLTTSDGTVILHKWDYAA